jgi:hypothetical protein
MRIWIKRKSGQCHTQNNCPVIQIRERSAGLGFSNRSIHAGEQTRYIGISTLYSIVHSSLSTTSDKREKDKSGDIRRIKKQKVKYIRKETDEVSIFGALNSGTCSDTPTFTSSQNKKKCKTQISFIMIDTDAITY